MRLRRIVALLVPLALAGPAAAQIRPSPLGDIYPSYNDCFKVATKDGIKPEVLGSLGWSRAKIGGGDGKSSANDPIIFYHPQRAPLIILSSEKGEGLCIVMARLQSASAFEEFKKPFGGKLPPPDKEGVIYFKADGHVIRLQRTGSAQEPSLTIGVMTPMEQK